MLFVEGLVPNSVLCRLATNDTFCLLFGESTPLYNEMTLFPILILHYCFVINIEMIVVYSNQFMISY